MAIPPVGGPPPGASGASGASDNLSDNPIFGPDYPDFDDSSYWDDPWVQGFFPPPTPDELKMIKMTAGNMAQSYLSNLQGFHEDQKKFRDFMNPPES